MEELLELIKAEIKGKFLGKEFTVNNNKIEVVDVVIVADSVKIALILNEDTENIKEISLRRFLDLVGFDALENLKSKKGDNDAS